MAKSSSKKPKSSLTGQTPKSSKPVSPKKPTGSQKPHRIQVRMSNITPRMRSTEGPTFRLTDPSGTRVFVAELNQTTLGTLQLTPGRSRSRRSGIRLMLQPGYVSIDQLLLQLDPEEYPQLIFEMFSKLKKKGATKLLKELQATQLASTDSHLILDIPTDLGTQGKLTPELLMNEVVPFLQALTQLQTIINNIRGRTNPHPIYIKQIHQYSPIEAIISGIGDALKAFWEDIIPYRREHVQESAKLDRQGKVSTNRITDAEADQAEAKADVATFVAQAEADQAQAEAEKKRAEADKTRAEAEDIRSNTEERRAERRLQLIMTIIDRYGAHLPPEQKLTYIAQLAGPLRILTTSPLEPIIGEPTD